MIFSIKKNYYGIKNLAVTESNLEIEILPFSTKKGLEEDKTKLF